MSGVDQTEARRVAVGLSEAQKRVMLHGHGMHDRFSTIEALVRKGLIAQRVCFPDGDGFPFTETGLAVRAVLAEVGK